MNKATFRRDLARSCKKQGLLIQPAAMTAWLKECERKDSVAFDVDAMLYHLKALLSQKTGPKLITLALFLEAMEKDRMEMEEEDVNPTVTKKSRTSNAMPTTAAVHTSTSTKTAVSNNHNIAPTPAFRLISAFDTPKLVYDAMRQQFRYDLNPNNSLMGTAQDLIAMRTQRYALVKQRVVRHRQQERLPALMTIDRVEPSNPQRDSSFSCCRWK